MRAFRPPQTYPRSNVTPHTEPPFAARGRDERSASGVLAGSVVHVAVDPYSALWVGVPRGVVLRHETGRQPAASVMRPTAPRTRA